MFYDAKRILTNDPRTIEKVTLGSKDLTDLTIEEFVAVSRYKADIEFSLEYCQRVKKSRNLIEKFLEENRLIYGVTTGFGENVSHVISREDANTLQKNLVRSHACSVGEPLKEEIVRAIILMMLINTGKGYSGISLEALEILKELLNRRVVPFAPGEGSVGYLAVEGHISLVLIGEGKAWYQGELLKGDEALRKAGLTPISLKCKEGLSLLNGTTSVTALATLALYDAANAAKALDITAALSFEALQATIKACDKRMHSVKKHIEQQRTAESILVMLKDSEIAARAENNKVQDAISLRATAQIHGAAKRLIKEALQSIYEEISSCSDNPIVFPEGDDGVALMNGNFDGSYVGSHADCACIAMAMLAKVSERRINRLTDRQLSSLPAFLVKVPGLNNGYMIPQYTAAGLVGEIKVLSQSSTIDNVPTCANQEDAVSTAYYASKKAYEVARKLQYIIAIELMLDIQALDLLSPLKPSSVSQAIYDLIRKEVPTLEEDRYIYPDIEYVYNVIREGDLLCTVKNIVGDLEF